jgi:hypothetical protein
MGIIRATSLPQRARDGKALWGASLHVREGCMRKTQGFRRLVIEAGLLVILVVVVIGAVQLRPRSEGAVVSPGAPLAAYPPPVTDFPTPTDPPYPPPGGPGSNPTPAYVQPPACQFGGGPTPEPTGPTLNDYVFSEPQVVLTSTTALGIAAWLPDNERLLITRRLPESNIEAIETFNVRTGETRLYAEKDGTNKPLWLPGLQAVAYVTLVGKSDNPLVFGHDELWISYGSPQQTEQVLAEISNFSLAADGEQLMYFSPSTGDVPITWSAATKTTQVMTALDLGDFIYPKYGETEHFRRRIPGLTFQIAVQPGGKHIAFFGSGLLYLADTQTSQVCEVDLGAIKTLPRRVSQAAWSADGRYLATLNDYGEPGGLAIYADIIVLDMLTGEKYTTDLGVSFIYEIAWSPDSRTLAALGEVGPGKGRAQMGLFLIDVSRKDTKRKLPDMIFGAGLRGTLLWRSDGQAITLDCTTGTPTVEFRVCITQIGTQP